MPLACASGREKLRILRVLPCRAKRGLPAAGRPTARSAAHRAKRGLRARSAAYRGSSSEDAAAFFAENGKKEGVVTTASGLQYKVVTEGKGPKPTADDTVEVNYAGTFLNGEEFDSSYKRGKPVTFAVKGVVPGWTEVLQLMPVGSKWEVVLPSDLAYGPGGTGRIGPNAALKFTIELLAIKEKPKAEAPAAAKPKK